MTPPVCILAEIKMKGRSQSRSGLVLTFLRCDRRTAQLNVSANDYLRAD
jgi:hypothetical protein